MTHTPREYAYADDATAKSLGLPPREGGYGLLFCTDERGRRVTRAGDPSITLALKNDIPADVDLAKDFPLSRPGWPDDNRPTRRKNKRRK
jgi:hypothetical protein